ncbi:Outer membrane protein beta-barrel domain containing protein [Comamonadaceae bacterium]
MKKLVIAAAAAAATLAAPQAFAQAKNFEGFSVTAAVNANNNSAELANKVDASRANVGVIAQYDFSIGSAFVFGLGASLGLNDFDIASNAKLQNANSIFIAPGIAVNSQTLIYGKVASVTAKADISGTSADISGVGYGIGARYLTSKNVYFQGEYVLNKYDDKKIATGTFKNQTGVLSFGVGYKF